MTTFHDASVEELRRESERSRAALTNTVVELRAKVSDTADDLKTRLSPANIKEEVKDYVREGSEQVFNSIERKARENPLRAVAIGAGLAYPLWGVVKAIPVPLMLVGAGLWLASRKAGSGENNFIDDIATKVTDAGTEGADRVVQLVRDAGAAVSDGVGAVANKVKAASQEARDSMTKMSETVASSVADTASSAARMASTATEDASNKVQAVGGQSRSAFIDLVDRNPLLVAGIGLAIGGFIAASLPSSNTEDRLFGERSDELKDKAREAAATSVERAKDAAAGMVDDVTAAAAREGLSPEGLGRAVDRLAEGAKAVVDRGVKTARGEPSQPAHSSQSNKS